MSTDARVTSDLMETLRDGQNGFSQAADRLADSDRPELSTKMRALADQRAAFATELEQMAATYGDDIDEDGSVAAAVHRGWMAVKDAIAGSDPKGVLDAAEQGEDHAVSQYQDALGKDDLSANLRALLERQFADVKQAHDDIRALRDAHA